MFSFLKWLVITLLGVQMFYQATTGVLSFFLPGLTIKTLFTGIRDIQSIPNLIESRLTEKLVGSIEAKMDERFPHQPDSSDQVCKPFVAEANTAFAHFLREATQAATAPGQTAAATFRQNLIDALPVDQIALFCKETHEDNTTSVATAMKHLIRTIEQAKRAVLKAIAEPYVPGRLVGQCNRVHAAAGGVPIQETLSLYRGRVGDKMLRNVKAEFARQHAAVGVVIQANVGGAALVIPPGTGFTNDQEAIAMYQVALAEAFDRQPELASYVIVLPTP